MTTEGQTEPQGQSQQQPPAEPPAEPQGGQAPPTEPDEETKRLANEQLRAWAEAQKAENQKLRGMAMKSALGEIGLNPEEGLGVAIVESYDGEITEDAVAKYAEEKYKYTSGQQPPPPEVNSGDKIDQLNAQGQSVTPEPEPDEGQKATQKIEGNDPEATQRDAISSVASKTSQFMEQHYGSQQT